MTKQEIETEIKRLETMRQKTSYAQIGHAYNLRQMRERLRQINELEKRIESTTAK